MHVVDRAVLVALATVLVSCEAVWTAMVIGGAGLETRHQKRPFDGRFFIF
jgi:hypothetical protein